MQASNDPVITRAIYDGTQVRVWWNPSTDSGVTGYVIQLTYVGEREGEIAYQSALIGGQAASFGALALAERLNTDVTYLVTVQAMWSSGAGETSVSLPLPTLLPVLRCAWYDGADMHFHWTPTPQAARGYQLIVYSVDSGLTYTFDIPDPSASEGVMPASAMGQGLDPQQQWTATVAAVGERNVSARSPAADFPKPLPTLGVSGTPLYQAGGRINAAWTPVAGSSITGYRLSLSSPQDATNLWADIDNPTARNGILPLPSPLAENLDYEFRVIALTSTGAGVASQPRRVVTTLPAPTSVSYDGSKVTMTWSPLFNVLVTGYSLQVLSLSSGLSYTTDIAGCEATGGSVQPPAALDAAQAWVARITANGPVSGQSIDIPLQVSAPGITTVRCDGESASVEWGALAGCQDGYAVTLFSGASPAAIAIAAGNAATLPLPEGVSGPTIRVAAKQGIATGPPSAPAAVISGAPLISNRTDPVSGATTLFWTAVEGASGYILRFSDGTVASAPAPPYGFPVPPLPNTDISVTVAARAVVAGTTSTGPASPRFRLATGQPALLFADFDGVNVSARWARLPRATGYRISVQRTGAGASETASFTTDGAADSASFPYTPADASRAYVVGIQALFNGATDASAGPLSAPLPLFRPGFLTSAAAKSAAYPNVYPATSLATALAATPAETLTVYLPQIGGATPLKGLPLKQGAFDLEENGDPASKTTYPYLLKFAADSDAWKFTAEPVRAGLQGDYVTFLKTAEQTAGVVPWGMALLQQVISRYLPQTFQETLYYGYGLNFPGVGAGSAWFDLRPGMVLRVVADPYQALTESSTLKWSTGYGGGPTQDYDLGGFIDSSGTWNVGFDSFIGQLVAGGALTVSPPPFHAETQQEGGIADAADLYFPGFRAPFYRLFIPTSLATPSAACPTDTPRSFVLAAAPTYNALTTTVNTPGGACPVAYFRGRAVVRVCLRVVLDGNELVVPVGTTVANLLERTGRLTSPSTAALKGLVVERGLGPVVLDPALPVSTAASYRVRLDWKTQPVYAPGWNALSLPLLPGDSVSTRA